MTKKDFKKLLIDATKNPAAGKTFQDILNDPNPISFLRAIVEYGNWPVRDLIDEVKRVSPERRMVILTNAFSLQIELGGIEQLVTDSETGELFDQLIDCFNTIHADGAVNYLKKMARHFPDEKIPKDESTRHEMIAVIKTKADIKNFRVLNSEYSNSVTEVIETLRQFVIKNQKRFDNVLSCPN